MGVISPVLCKFLCPNSTKERRFQTVTKTAGSWIIAMALFILCGSAYGDTFDMSWTSGFGAGSGTLTANSSGGGAYLVTAINGTQNGSVVSLFPPGTFGGNDNDIFPSGSLLDSAGLSFTAAGSSLISSTTRQQTRRLFSRSVTKTAVVQTSELLR
jgi:hypothetical protein